MRRTKIEVEQTSADILDAAYHMFSQQGYSATNIQDIAEVLGISRSPIYYHYNNKLELYCQAARRHIEKKLAKYKAIWADNTDFFSKIRSILIQYTSLAAAENGFFMECKTNNQLAEIKKEYDNALRLVFEITVKAVRAASKAGVLKKNIAPQEVVYNLYVLYYGITHVGELDLFSINESERLNIIETLINGIKVSYAA
jgi:TetR/AcrR family acrAB operon transcriptional repressor